MAWGRSIRDTNIIPKCSRRQSSDSESLVIRQPTLHSQNLWTKCHNQLSSSDGCTVLPKDRHCSNDTMGWGFMGNLSLEKLWEKTEKEGRRCGLNNQRPYRLACLNTWSPAVGTLRVVMEPLGGGALEQVHHQGRVWGLTAWPQSLFSLSRVGYET